MWTYKRQSWVHNIQNYSLNKICFPKQSVYICLSNESGSMDCHGLKLPSCNTVTYRKEARQRGAVIGPFVLWLAGDGPMNQFMWFSKNTIVIQWWSELGWQKLYWMFQPPAGGQPKRVGSFMFSSIQKSHPTTEGPTAGVGNSRGPLSCRFRCPWPSTADLNG